MRIAVTDTLGSEHKFQKYIDWLQSVDDTVECVKMSYRLDNRKEIESCDGLVLTGGHDVDPSLYGGPVDHPAIIDVDRKRDDFEMEVLSCALQRRIPVLGICRGLQLANVYFGGTLIPDLPEAGFPSHKHDVPNKRHGIAIDNDCFLHSLVHVTSGEINSSHHQAVDHAGPKLKVVARSSDGVVEALEFARRGDYPFFLLVQWHPERMDDSGNPLSIKLLQHYLYSIQKEITQSIGT